MNMKINLKNCNKCQKELWTISGKKLCGTLKRDSDSYCGSCLNGENITLSLAIFQELQKAQLAQV